MSYSTTERIVLDAVQEAPITAKSKSEQFRIRSRAQTPHHLSDSDSSAESLGSSFSNETEVTIASSSQEDMDALSAYGETDSSGKMDLIAESFQKATTTMTGPIALDTKLKIFG